MSGRVDELLEQLGALGVRIGDALLVHASLRATAPFLNGAETLIAALQASVEASGTLVMPTFTPQLVHPGCRPPFGVKPSPHATVDVPFSLSDTPCGKRIGMLPETFRRQSGVLRSTHPHTSFAAWGDQAAEVVGHHPLPWRLSQDGPLGALCSRGAKVLMLGTGWSTCTALHLAEYETPYPGRLAGMWPVPVESPSGEVDWLRVPELLVWEGDFDTMGADLEGELGHDLTIGRVGSASARLVDLQALRARAATWLGRHRDLSRGVAPPGWEDVHAW